MLAMASMRQFLAVVALAAQALAAPTNVRYVVHEERANLNHGFVKRERLDGAAVLPMRIGLTQTNLHMGYDLLMEV
jgi:tripeptidyl-peptidase I